MPGSCHNFSYNSCCIQAIRHLYNSFVIADCCLPFCCCN